MLKEIRKQPEHIRAIFMWLSVFIVFSLIFFVWFGFFKAKLVSLLNNSENAVAKQESPFTAIGQDLGELKAMIWNVFNKPESELKDSSQDQEIAPKMFPLSGEK